MRFATALLGCVGAATAAQPPHLLLMLADDLGYNNVGWHNPAILTPALDALVARGVRLERHYAYRFCSPSRASLMTGRYPLHVQERMGPYWTTYTGPPANMTLLPAKLKQAGYATHHVGKWHLGSAYPAYTALGRGFDTSFGFLDGMADHWTHRMVGCNSSVEPDAELPDADLPGTQWSCWGNAVPLDACDDLTCYHNLSARFFHDLWSGRAPAYHARYEGRFSQEIHEEEILRVLAEHPLEVPLLLYMGFQLVHSPIQVPKRFVDLYSTRDLPFLGARKVYGFVSALDESIGRIVDAVLQRPGMWEQTLIVFSADNGGPLETMTNHPLRGGKFSDWEGGVRTAAFVSGGFLPERVRGTSSDGFVMLADWWVTLVTLAGLPADDEKAARAGLPPVDGLDMWPMLSGRNLTSPRTELPLSADTLVVGEWKLITGQQKYNTWSPANHWPPDYECNDRNASHPANCTPGCLFNIQADPSERHDLARTNRTLLERMLKRLQEVQATVWHNCDPPSICAHQNPQACCDVAHSKYGDVYGPYLPDV
jgi:arylsulfatase B